MLLSLVCSSWAESLPLAAAKRILSSRWTGDMSERYRTLSLQVPQDDWGGYPTGGKDGEIPCRRMRSGSYIKAMGDEESGDSDGSPKTSPKAVARRFASRRSSSVDTARIK
jgi:hypothetical protein